MKKCVLITGATSGIGKELCYRFAEHKNSLILVGRNQDKLLELSKKLEEAYVITTTIIHIDLSAKNSCFDIYAKIKELNLEVDILINAAGFGLYFDFLDRDIKLHHELIEININCLITLCYLFGRDMRRRRKGYIINFSSISGFFSGPYLSTYYASKAFVLSFSNALAKELEPFNVAVLAICPGVIQTPFYKKAKADLSYSHLLHRMKPHSSFWISKKIYKLISKKKTGYKLIGIKNKILVFFSHFIPNKWVVNIVAYIQAKK